MYRILSQYQKDGYNSLVDIAEKYGGAFLCDGVGLGKTFIGLMLIERLVLKENKNVVLLVPAAARESVWENNIRKYIPQLLGNYFFSLIIANHTELALDTKKDMVNAITSQADVIIIDEAHHFRTHTSGRYKALYNIMNNGPKKQIYMLTATPINNSFKDLQNMIELFTCGRDDYFKDPPLNIRSLSGHFKKMERKLDSSAQEDSDLSSSPMTGDLFRGDKLVSELIVQRSRKYVRKSMEAEGNDSVQFPIRQDPSVVNYSLKKAYGGFIEDFVATFDQMVDGRLVQIISLPIYSPFETRYFLGNLSEIDEFIVGRQNQVVNLIRLLLLKRFESSCEAFKETCIKIFERLYQFVKDYREYDLDDDIVKFEARRAILIRYIHDYIEAELCDDEETIEDYREKLPDYIWNTEPSVSVKDFNIPVMIKDSLSDLETLSIFIRDIRDIDPSEDDKIQALITLLRQNMSIQPNKVLIFSEYQSTAKYIYRELIKSGLKAVEKIDGSTSNRREIIERFSPYYNDKTSDEISNEIKVLVATDVLSEGLNLQDATCIVNYELHWNPVRLMQRIGRVDRRRNDAIEKKLLSDHPEMTKTRPNVYLWNFLPPNELEQLLSLYETVSRKTLRISKTLGIEGKKILTPSDDYESLKEFNSSYEGVESASEKMALEFERLMREYSDFYAKLDTLPKKLSSGKSGQGKGLFLSYRLPIIKDGEWDVESGPNRWYYYDFDNDSIIEDKSDIWNKIRCDESEPRKCNITSALVKKARKAVEKRIDMDYMRNAQVPIGIKPELIAWLQIS